MTRRSLEPSAMADLNKAPAALRMAPGSGRKGIGCGLVMPSRLQRPGARGARTAGDAGDRGARCQIARCRDTDTRAVPEGVGGIGFCGRATLQSNIASLKARTNEETSS
jgi:hypothetical protein